MIATCTCLPAIIEGHLLVFLGYSDLNVDHGRLAFVQICGGHSDMLEPVECMFSINMQHMMVNTHKKWLTHHITGIYLGSSFKKKFSCFDMADIGSHHQAAPLPLLKTKKMSIVR